MGDESSPNTLTTILVLVRANPKHIHSKKSLNRLPSGLEGMSSNEDCIPLGKRPASSAWDNRNIGMSEDFWNLADNPWELIVLG